MPPFDSRLTHATIIDGTEADRYRGSLFIKDDKITAMIPDNSSRSLPDARKTIDGNNLVLAPGFIGAPEAMGDFPTSAWLL